MAIRLGSAYGQIKIDTKDVEASASRTSKAFSSIESQFDSLGRRLSRIGTSLSTAITVPLAGIGAASLKIAANFETVETAFSTLLGSSERAKKTLEELFDFTATTPFQFEDVSRAGKILLSFGEDADNLTRTLQSVGDVAAGVSAPLSEIAEIYGKARVQGRLFQEDINQLTGRGIPIIQELAKQFGVAESQVRDLVTAGAVSFENLEAAFVSLTNEGGRFAGLMEAQSQTVAGLFSTLKDQVTLSLGAIGKTLIETFDLRSKLSDAINLLGSFRERLNNLIQTNPQLVKMGLIFAGIAAAIGPLILALGGLITAFGAVSGALAPVIAVLTGPVGVAIAIVIAGIIALKKNLFGLQDAFREISSQIEIRFGDKLRDIAGKMQGYGLAIVEQLSIGVARGVELVARAIAKIASIFTFWLKPGSPPRALPEIDDWGKGTAEAWIEGFSNADFSVIRDIGAKVEEALRNIDVSDGEQAGIVERIIGSRSAIQEAVSTLRETGGDVEAAMNRVQGIFNELPQSVADYTRELLEAQVANEKLAEAQTSFDRVSESINNWRDAMSEASRISQDALEPLGNVVKRVRDRFGELPAPIQKYVSALENVKRAARAVTDAQKRLNDVTDRYAKKLDPLNERLRQLDKERQAIEDQERIAELQEILASDVPVSEKRLAQIELEEIALRKQISTVEDERDAAIKAEEEKLKAAEAALKATEEEAAKQERFANEYIQAEQNKAQAVLDTAKAVADAANEEVALAQAVIDEQNKVNDLYKEQAKLLEDIAKAASGAGVGVVSPEFSLPNIEEQIESINDSLKVEFPDPFSPIKESFSNLKRVVSDNRIFSAVKEAADKTFPAIEDAIKAFVDYVEKNLPNVERISNRVFSGVLEVVNEVAEEVAPFILEQFQTIVNWTKENWPLIKETIETVVNAIKNIVGTIILAISSVWQEGNGEILASVSNTWEAIKTLISGSLNVILSTLTAILQFVTGDFAGAWETIKNTVSIAVDTIIGTLSSVADAVLSLFGSNLSEIIGSLSNTWDSINETVKTKTTELLESVEQFLLSVQETMSDTWETIREGAEVAWETIKGTINQKLEELFEIAGIDLNEFKQQWSEIFEDIALITETVWQRIKNSVLIKLEELRLSVSEWLTIYREEWNVFWGEISLLTTELWETIKNSIFQKLEELIGVINEKKVGIESAWASIWQAVIDFLVSKFEEIKSIVSSKMQGIVDIAFSYKNSFVSVGSSIVEGMVEGVLGAVGTLVSAVTNVLDSALDAAKNRIRANSPSDLYADDVGQPITQGVAKGVNDAKSILANALKSLLAPENIGLTSSPSLVSAINSINRGSLGSETTAQAISSSTNNTFGGINISFPDAKINSDLDFEVFAERIADKISRRRV